MKDSTVTIVERLSNGLNPSVLPVRTSEPVDIVVRRSGCGGMGPPLYGGVAISGIHQFNPPPAGQALGGVAEKCDCPLVQVLQFAFRTPTPHQCRDRVDKEAKFTLAFPKVVIKARAFE